MFALLRPVQKYSNYVLLGTGFLGNNFVSFRPVPKPDRDVGKEPVPEPDRDVGKEPVPKPDRDVGKEPVPKPDKKFCPTPLKS